MKRSILKSFVSLIAGIAVCFIATSAFTADPIEKTGKVEVNPKASIIVKGQDIFIEIKDLALSADEVERLKKVIEGKFKFKKLPIEWNANMKISVTEDMLKEAGIDYKDRYVLSKDSDDEFEYSQWHHGRHGKDAVKIFHDMKVSKDEKYKDIVVISGNLDFEGEADNVVVIFGNARIAPDAVIKESVVVIFGTSDISEKATINGEQVGIDGGKVLKNIFKFILIPGALIGFITVTPFLVISVKLLFWAVLFGFSILLFLIFPKTSGTSGQHLKNNPLPSLGFGLLGLLLVLPVSLFLLLSIVGIPLLPIFGIFMFLLLFGGYAVAAKHIGQLLPVDFIRKSGAWSLLAGIIILGIVSMIPVIGHIAKYIAWTAGFGAVIYAVFTSIFRRGHSSNDQNSAVPA